MNPLTIVLEMSMTRCSRSYLKSLVQIMSNAKSVNENAQLGDCHMTHFRERFTLFFGIKTYRKVATAHFEQIFILIIIGPTLGHE